MLQGRRAFGRDTPADTLSAILKDPPPVMTSSPEQPLPPALQEIVRRCLEKDPAARFQSTSDLAFALATSTGSGSVTSALPASIQASRAADTSPRSRLMWPLSIAAALALGGIIGLALDRWRTPAPAPAVMEFLIPPPAADVPFASMPLPGLAPTAPQVGLSPDGRQVAFVAIGRSNVRQLWIRMIDAGVPRPIERTDGANSWPFWSPDGRVVVFAANGFLMKFDVTRRDSRAIHPAARGGAARSVRHRVLEQRRQHPLFDWRAGGALPCAGDGWQPGSNHDAQRSEG